MNNIPSSSPSPSSSSVPSIHIQTAEDVSTLFDGGEFFSQDIYSLYNMAPDAGLYPCSQDLHSEYATSTPLLEDIPELSHLTTTSQSYLTGNTLSLPYAIHQDNAITPADTGLSPSSLGSSPIPSPASSFGSSLSPSSLYEPLTLSDSESPASPSPATPDQPFLWPSQGLSHRSSDALVLYPPFMAPFQNDSDFSAGPGPQRSRSRSPYARREPVASKAMLEANSRRRRHPAQFQCEECDQTFTALFSLKRHAQSHTGERPFVCSIHGCTQRFYNSSDCKRHEKSRKRHKDLMTE